MRIVDGFLIALGVSLSVLEPINGEDLNDKNNLPAYVFEAMPVSPGPGYVWNAGHWQWQNQWIWLKGHWLAKPQREAVWIMGNWQKNALGWIWQEGHWTYPGTTL